MIRLGSSSETRAGILQSHGVNFIQSGCDFDEDSIVTTIPKKFVYEATLGKLNSCIDKFGIETPLLVADTVVTARGKLLRKAYSEEEARDILLSQSGSKTSIITAMVYKSVDIEFVDISVTDYIFDIFDEVELNKFLQSGEWRGKAGACMVEGFCKNYIREVRGLESTAMGLQIEKLKPFLKGVKQ